MPASLPTFPSDLLRDRVAIVSGAGDGIGRGIALALARCGAHVAVCALEEPLVHETAALIERLDRRSLAAAFDAGEEGNVDRFVADVAATLGAPTILIPNAGVMPVVEIERVAATDIDACYRAKLKSAALLAKYCVPHMRQAGGGSITCMASVTGNVGFAKHAVYGAMNAAIQGLVRGLAMELAPFGIRVNSVSPGTVDSPMLHRYIAESGEEPATLRASFDAAHPRGAIASIEDVANAFVFLSSSLAANITGEDLRCDGGFSFKGGQPDA